MPLHAEGLLTHKTMKSINRTVLCADSSGLSVDVIFVLDRPTDETKSYLQSSSIIPYGAKFIPADLGDVGLARNLGVQHAESEYVAMHDGDDLTSENWLLRAHEVNSGDKRYVIHPEITVGFGTDSYVVFHTDQRQCSVSEIDIAFANCWPYTSFARRATFLEVPYAPTPRGSGFGYEDWHWNCEVMAHGFVHTVAPGTAFFNRLKQSGSRFVEHNKSHAVMPNSALIDRYEKRDNLPTRATR